MYTVLGDFRRFRLKRRRRKKKENFVGRIHLQWCFYRVLVQRALGQPHINRRTYSTQTDPEPDRSRVTHTTQRRTSGPRQIYTHRNYLKKFTIYVETFNGRSRLTRKLKLSLLNELLKNTKETVNHSRVGRWHLRLEGLQRMFPVTRSHKREAHTKSACHEGQISL